MIVVDSSVWIARFRGAVNVAARKLQILEEGDTDEILIGDIVMVEVLQGPAMRLTRPSSNNG